MSEDTQIEEEHGELRGNYAGIVDDFEGHKELAIGSIHQFLHQ